MAFSEALKPKPGSKHLSTIVNAEGKLVQAETREDELQRIKFDEIIDTLFNAGYYRAQIKGLSEFDKVVGGMCWCIDICNMDLDVDLLFQENSTIGQKIALTEKIVAVLPIMKCPHAIEPHQIQGLDFIHISPVIEWLVKKSIQSREEMEDYLTLFAVHQFDKYHPLPNEQLNPEFVKKTLKNVKAVQDKYRALRKYRRVENQPTDLKSRVQSTLYEYGYAPLQDEEDETNEQVQVQVVDEVRLRQLAKTMESLPDVKLGTSAVSTIVSKQASEITEAAANYSNVRLDPQNTVSYEIKKLKQKEEELTKLKHEYENKIENLTNQLEKLKEMSLMPTNFDELSEGDKMTVGEIEKLLLINESLKQQELQFREHCKGELSNFQNLVKEAETFVENTTEEYVDSELQELSKEVGDARLRLAKVTSEVASLNRFMDQIPGRSELAQYQRRFLELHNQVSAKLRETKQYYTLYNTLNDTHQYLNNELTLLNSISENYAGAMSSPHTKEQFMKQFKSIIEGVKQNKAKVEQKRNEERDLKEKYKTRLQQLIDEQRLYANALKQFTEECKINEVLAAKIKALSQK